MCCLAQMAVLKVIDRAQTLGQDDVAVLLRHIDPTHAALFSACWNAWLAPLAPDSDHLCDDHSNMLAIFTEHDRSKTDVGYSVSPIGAEFTVLSRMVADRAREILGDRAFSIDEDG